MSELGMRVTEKFYPGQKNDPLHKILINDAMIRFRKCETKKNSSQINQEIQICRQFWNCYPHHYFTHNLYLKEIQVKNEDLINFIPQFFWYYLFLPHYRSPKYSLITDNKIITEQFFRSLEIAQPTTICRILNGKLYSSSMKVSTFDQIQKELTLHDFEKLFMKPVDGSGGHGIFIFHRTDDMQYVSRDNCVFSQKFLDTLEKKQDYIIQAGIIQDSEISRIYPESVNTCRIITENKNGNARIVGSMLRIGCGSGEVDNASSGGISISIDKNNGKLGDFAVSYDGKTFSKHPNTQFEFRNFTVPGWSEILKFALESAGKMPFFTHLGWDIALTHDGPVAVETNRNPAIDGMEMACGGLREAFGIDDPNYYWKHPGKTLQE
jgi:hypothetical protein